MNKLVLSSFLMLFSSLVKANSVCDLLDRELPGSAYIKVEIASLRITREMIGLINKKTETMYTVTTKDESRNFTLISKGSGEDVTCRISVESSMDGDLIDFNLKTGTYIFLSDNSNIRLTVVKK